MWAMRKLRRPSWEAVITFVVVAGAGLFVFAQLSPSLIFANTTPAGGDTGAHVWGPDFMKNHLLPNGRITGWAPAWYSGFPAYTFYFPLPALTIALLAFLIPYEIAFKLVSILGLISLPAAAYTFGRLSGMKFPGPPVLAVATVPFLFYYGFYDKATGAWSNTIYGGNIASSLAGEFAFSISLSFALVFLGVFARGLQTGRHRALSAILLALTGISHILPTVFAVGGALVLFLLHAGRKRAVYLATTLGLGAFLAAFWTIPFLFRFGSYANNMGWEKLTKYTDNLFPSGILWVTVLAFAGAAASVILRRRTGLALVGMTALAGLTFIYAPDGRLWNARALPFWYLCMYLLAGVAVAEAGTALARLLARDGESPSRAVLLGTPIFAALATFVVVGLPLQLLPDWFGLPNWRWVLLIALAAALAASSFRRAAAAALAIVAVVAGIASLLIDLGRTWDGRVESLFHLSLFLLGAIALVELAVWCLTRWAGSVREGQLPWLEVAVPVMAAVLAWVAIGSPLEVIRRPFQPWTTSDTNFLPAWARWNYSGYERKSGYPEYKAIIDTMAKVGREHGCGRTHWEYESGLDRFGTPLALMLLPYWTDGCIGSMEGLYFESSATVPYHFLSAGELSKAPSNPMRNLPYRGMSIKDGVKHLQLLGTRYYMAFSPEALAQARSNPDLKEIASTGAWHVFEVRGSELVTPLNFAPAVMTGPHSGVDWLNASVDWYMDFNRHEVLLAGSGPKEWPRVAVRTHPTDKKTHGEGVTIDPAPRQPVPPATVTNIRSSDDKISFDVDRTGSPVLVKTSYFPNWQVSGAKGPYRVTPNLMVVVPTSNHVSMHYGYTPVDILGWLLTLVGLAGVIFVWRHPMTFPADDRGTDHDKDEPRESPGKAESSKAADDFESLPGRRSQPVPIPDRGDAT